MNLMFSIFFTLLLLARFAAAQTRGGKFENSGFFSKSEFVGGDLQAVDANGLFCSGECEEAFDLIGAGRLLTPDFYVCKWTSIHRI